MWKHHSLRARARIHRALFFVCHPMISSYFFWEACYWTVNSQISRRGGRGGEKARPRSQPAQGRGRKTASFPHILRVGRMCQRDTHTHTQHWFVCEGSVLWVRGCTIILVLILSRLFVISYRIYPVFTFVKFIPVFGTFWGTLKHFVALLFIYLSATQIILLLLLFLKIMILALCLVFIYYY